MKRIPNFVSNSKGRGDNEHYDYDDLDFNTPNSLVDDEEVNIPEDTPRERPKRIRKPNPRYKDYVLY